MNWGHGITIAFILFAGFTIYLVVRSFQENIDLVTDTYYAEELAYQQRINQITNTTELDNPIEIKFSEDGLLLSFSEQVANALQTGTVHLYRPSDAAYDKHYELTLETNNTMTIPAGEMISGKYRLKIEWQDQEKPFYFELDVIVP